MRLICPACAAVASMEAWANEPIARQVIDIISKLPGLIASRTPAYLGLFRKGARGLSWPRALKIVTDLQALVSSGVVQWDRGEERPAPPQLWAEIMDKMIARTWTDPLDDNNYLQKVVWSEAKPLAAKAERASTAADRQRIEPGEDEFFKPTRRRTCFNCGTFRPPKGCSAGNRPISGDLTRGCGKAWTAKASSIGELASELTVNLQKE